MPVCVVSSLGPQERAPRQRPAAAILPRRCREGGGPRLAIGRLGPEGVFDGVSKVCPLACLPVGSAPLLGLGAVSGKVYAGKCRCRVRRRAGDSAYW